MRARGRPLLLARRGLAAALLLTALALFLRPGTGDPGVLTVVSAHDIAAGSTIDDADVRVVAMPAAVRPSGAFEAADPVRGRLLSGAARAGEPITDARLLGLPGTGDPRLSTVPVRLADAGVAALLRPGSRVDVVAAEDGERGRRVLASMATVVTVVTVSTADAGARHPPGSSATGPLLLLSLPPETATQVAGASLGRPVTVTLR
ncbi:SAF domain-containing protein [Amycolatopsis minnesotensis]|uniref:SAF domain-containing protein n=1 Tax=Amycolatopsis minnesotensis TaxID=337894 RepID=A0ABN2RNB7_9PSEU